MNNLDTIFDKSKYIAVQQNQLQLLKELIKEKLTVGHHGGLFYINSELLNFLDLLERSDYDSAVVDDMNGNPTEIPNVKEFKATCMEKYAQEQNNALAEIRRLRKARTVQELVQYDFNEEN
jgi:hypothetical protein|tara:strand:- start:2947 stop:3309 length:363 start_codon:yes stop_codon:yes gene_type:complete